MEVAAVKIRGPLLLICMIFFVLGFFTWVNAMLIPYFKVACELTNFESYLVTFAFYISYLVIALPASLLLNKVGFKKGMTTAFFLMATGAFTFIPAAYSRSYLVFLLGLFIIGIGLAILQTAVNPYVTLLGARERAAQRISIMGICNKTAGIIAPLLLAAAIIRPGDTQLFHAIPGMAAAEKDAALNMLVRRLILPYATVGGILSLLGLLIRYSPLPEPGKATQQAVGHRPVWQHPHLVLGAVAIFLHVGSQLIAVDTIINYAHARGLSIPEAKSFPSYTLFTTICGYLLGISLIPWAISQLTALKICTLLGVVLSVMVATISGTVHFLGHTTDISVWFLVLLGFANSMIWAGIWPLALDGLGSQAKLGASLLIMGLSGNAVLPLLYGRLADVNGHQPAYWVLLPCYIFLTFYAFYGHNIKKWSLCN
ncbi:glucose/galactose transporter [Chitinophaga sp. YR573]|uniref:sugar MFS transporter n=1 Tax=Chitinophaga sp. YR573 TaxID=1881040 RepID=UPI0008D044B5|nr:sugar MFS transporter [Chitinophaga sp. YR573]SEW35838.1 glucose/galactose transporter [Chitinophaga sp. YR573]